MVDFVKIIINSKPLADRIKEGEIWCDYWSKGKKYRNLIGLIYDSGRIQIEGSLHKYMQTQNWGDFTRLDLWDAIAEVRLLIGIDDLEPARLENLEFGVNLKVDYDPSELLNNVILYKDESFKCVSTHRLKGICLEAVKDQYWVKIYDKGKQCKRPAGILRFEVHVRRMIFLKSIGISSLGDLMVADKLDALGKLLQATWAEVLIKESLDLTSLTKIECRQYALATNPLHWQQINRKQRCLLKQKYELLIEKYAPENRKKVTGELLMQKWEDLMQRLKNGNVLIDTVQSSEEQFPHLGKRLKRSLNAVCAVTGQDISHQKDGSKFVSAKTVATTPELAKQLEKGRRTNDRKHTHIKEEERLAKNVRNKDSNPRNNRRRRIIKKYGNKQQLTLLPMSEMISEETKHHLEYFNNSRLEVRL